jgi:hypothetical protein
VLLHQLELIVRERAGLVDDLARDVQLADVVDGGRGPDALDVLVGSAFWRRCATGDVLFSDLLLCCGRG